MLSIYYYFFVVFFYVFYIIFFLHLRRAQSSSRNLFVLYFIRRYFLFYFILCIFDCYLQLYICDDSFSPFILFILFIHKESLHRCYIYNIWVILLQIEHLSDRHLFDLTETFFTDSMSKKKRYVSEEFFFICIFSIIQVIEHLRMASFLAWRLIFINP